MGLEQRLATQLLSMPSYSVSLFVQRDSRVLCCVRSSCHRQALSLEDCCDARYAHR